MYTPFERFALPLLMEGQKQRGTMIVAYNRGRRGDIESIINNGTFRSRDQLFGPGIYLNRDIHRTIGSRYGEYITEVGITDADRYLHLDWDTYKESGAKFGGDEQNWDFIWKQLEAAGVTGDEIVHGTDNFQNKTFREVMDYALAHNHFEADTYNGGTDINDNTSMILRWAICVSHSVYRKVRNFFKGVFYTGGKDRECIVAFDPSSLTVMGVVKCDRDDPKFNAWYSQRAGFDVNHTKYWSQQQQDSVYGIPDDEIKFQSGLINDIENGARQPIPAQTLHHRISSREWQPRGKEPVDSWDDVLDRIAATANTDAELRAALRQAVARYGINQRDGSNFMPDIKSGGYHLSYGIHDPNEPEPVIGITLKQALENRSSDPKFDTMLRMLNSEFHQK